MLEDKNKNHRKHRSPLNLQIIAKISYIVSSKSHLGTFSENNILSIDRNISMGYILFLWEEKEKVF